MVNSGVPVKKRMKDAISFAIELADENIQGVVLQPLQIVDDVERINCQILAAFRKWRIRNPNEPPVTIQIPGELVIREST